MLSNIRHVKIFNGSPLTGLHVFYSYSFNLFLQFQFTISRPTLIFNIKEVLLEILFMILIKM